MSWDSHHTRPTSHLFTSFHAECDLQGPASDMVKGLSKWWLLLLLSKLPTSWCLSFLELDELIHGTGL